MSASDSQWVGNRLNKLTSSLRIWREQARGLIPARWLLLLIGVSCVAYSQYMMEQRAVLGSPNPLAEQWNVLYRLEIVNLHNVLAALPYFVAGVLLCGWMGLPSSWKDNPIDVKLEWPAWTRTELGKHIPRLLAGTALIAYLLVQLGKHQYAPVFPFLWVTALFLFSYTFWKWDREHHINLSPGIERIDILLLLILLLGGLALVSYALQDIPPIMVPDEGSFWENARAIAIKKYQPVFFDSGVYTFPVASTIYQGWIMRWLGGDLWSWRFSSVLAAVATVLPLYLLAREWFNRWTAVASSVMMLANPYFLAFARMGYNNSQALLPVTLAVYFWVLASRRGSVFYLWLAGLTVGLGFYTYSATWLGLVTLVLGIVYHRLRKQISWKHTFGALALILLAWTAAFAPRLAYASSGDLRSGLVYKMFETSFFNVFYGRVYYEDQELFRTMPVIENPQFPAIFFDPLIYGELLLRGVVRTVLVLFNPYLISEHFLITPLAGMISPIFFAIGFALFLRRWNQSPFGLALLWLISGLVFLSIIGAFPPRHTHMVSVIPVIALIAGAGASAVVESATELLPARLASFRAAILHGCMALLILVILYSGMRRYFVQMPATFPPSYEDYVSWVAWSTEKPVQLIYLGPTDVAHRVAYLTSNTLVPHTYINLDLHTFSPEEFTRSGLPTVIFAETPAKEGIPYLEHPPAGFGTVLDFRNKDGVTLGYAMTNSPEVQLNWNAGFSTGLDSLLNTPVRIVLLILLIPILVLAGVELWNRLRFPSFAFASTTDFPQESATDQTEGNVFEVEFRLRIRMPDRKRKQT